MAQDHADAGDFSRGADLTDEVARRHHRACPGARHHAGDALDIGVTAADIHAVRHRARDQPGILASEKDIKEIRAGFRNHAHAVAALQARLEEFAAGRDGLVAQIAKAHHMLKLSARRVEIKAGFAPSGIFQAFDQGTEFGTDVRQM